MALAMNNSSTTEVCHTFFGRSFSIQQDPSAPNHGLVLWDASVCFLRWVESNPKEAAALKGTRVLEVGAGTGLLGIVLAHALGCKVVMTDLPSVLPNLELNWAQNPLQPGCQGSVSVAAYDWTAPLPEGLVGAPIDYIIGTDVGYSESLNPLLLSSAAEVVRVCEERHAKCPTVIFVNELRCEIAQGVFDAEAPKHFKVQRVRDSKLHPSYQGQNMILLKLTKKKGGGVHGGEKEEE
jgi:predicted nicotinamide N-methyase